MFPIPRRRTTKIDQVSQTFAHHEQTEKIHFYGKNKGHGACQVDAVCHEKTSRVYI